MTKLPLVPFVVINLTRLSAGVCMKVRFKSKVIFFFSSRRFVALLWLKRNLWVHGIKLA